MFPVVTEASAGGSVCHRLTLSTVLPIHRWSAVQLAHVHHLKDFSTTGRAGICLLGPCSNDGCASWCLTDVCWKLCTTKEYAPCRRLTVALHAGAAASAALQAPGQQAAAASTEPLALLQSAGYLALAALEDSLDLSARLCGSALQTMPVVGARLAAAEPDLAGQGPTLPARLLRRGMQFMYGTAGNLAGLGQGIVYLAKQR